MSDIVDAEPGTSVEDFAKELMMLAQQLNDIVRGRHERQRESYLEPRRIKRPVAFRVKSNIGWVYYDSEERAAASAKRQNTDYQGLYVRDGK